MTNREDTTVTTITEEAFTAAMRAAVEERGADWRYPGNNEAAQWDGWRDANGNCQYQNRNGEPACLIGLALNKIDPALVPIYGDTDGAPVVLRARGASEALQNAAGDAQDAQDGGLAWGAALDAYERALAERVAA